MDNSSERLRDLTRSCSSATSAEDLRDGALPALADISGAHVVTLLQRRPDEVVVAAQAGSSQLGDPAATFDLCPPELAEIPVDDGWAGAGVERVLATQLPGHFGALLVGFQSGQSPAPLTETAVGVLHAGFGRLDAEERYDDLMERVNNAQILADMGDYDWHIASDTNQWSDQLYRIYGHEPQSFNASYEKFLSHIHPDDRERIMQIHQQAYASGEPYQMIERIVRPDGEIRYLSSNGQVLMDENKNPIRFRGTCIDITDRVLAEQERERSVGRFEGLVESSPDAILVIDAEGIIVQANGRAHELLGGLPVGRKVDEVLPAQQVVTGRGVEALGLDGRSLTLDVTVATLSRGEEKGVKAAFLNDAAPRLAREAMAASLREIEVRRRQAIEINDNVVQGLTAATYALEHGNAPASALYLQRTLDSARRMMHDLLDPLHGEELEPGDLVRATPSTLGAPAMPPVQAPASDAARSATNGHRRILIVDDTPDMRTLIRMKLETSGVGEVVGEAADGEEAVRLATELKPDLVLLDLAMPRMDGLQALPLIREAVADVQVVVLSGFDDGVMAAKATEAGAVGYVEKGTALDDLTAVIEGALASRAGTPS